MTSEVPLSRRPAHHRRIKSGPLAGKWVPMVLLDGGGACAQQAAARSQEAIALEQAGAVLVQGPVPAHWFKDYWPELAEQGEVDFAYVEAYSSESLKAAA